MHPSGFARQAERRGTPHVRNIDGSVIMMTSIARDQAELAKEEPMSCPCDHHARRIASRISISPLRDVES
jgi:transposase